MKKLIVLATTLFLSTASMAATVNADKELHTTGYASQAQAYEAGFDLLEQYQDLSSVQLGKKLNMRLLDVDMNSFEMNSAEVSVEEFAQVRGESQYRAVVDIDYQYEKDSDWN